LSIDIAARQLDRKLLYYSLRASLAAPGKYGMAFHVWNRRVLNQPFRNHSGGPT
jgi:hypothetical protein